MYKCTYIVLDDKRTLAESTSNFAKRAAARTAQIIEIPVMANYILCNVMVNYILLTT
jgi:hypothetical protein